MDNDEDEPERHGINLDLRREISLDFSPTVM